MDSTRTFWDSGVRAVKVVFNREYQKRATRLAVRRELARQGAAAFYRPAQRPDPRAKPEVRSNVRSDVPEQLTLNFYPLRDVFLEAYE